MKDRYQDFIESQQDPSENEYEDEEIDDEYDEDYEDEEEEDEEEEEVQPVQSTAAPPPKPFGNGLNIQLGNLRGSGNSGNSNSSNNSNKNQNANNVKKNVGYGYTPKQAFVKPAAPAPETVKPQTQVQPEPVRAEAPQPAPAPKPEQIRAAVPEPAQKPEPIDFSPIEEEGEEEQKEKRSWKGLGGLFKSRKQQNDDDFETESEETAEEDLEEVPPKRGFFSAFLKRRPNEENEEEEEISAENAAAEEEEEETPRKRHFGVFSAFFKKKGNAEETDEEEEAVQAESVTPQPAAAETETEEEDESHPSRNPVSRLFASFTERFRGKFGKKETLDEFKEEIAKTADEPEAAPRKKLGKWQKIGIISTSACVLLAAAYAGGEIILKRNRQAAEKNTEEILASAEAAETIDVLENLGSRADTIEGSAELGETLATEELVTEPDIFTETPEETATDEGFAETDYFAADDSFAPSENNNEETADETLADAEPADVTSAEEVSADGAVLGAAAAAAALAAADTAGSDSIDFDFGETVTAEKADSAAAEENISDALEVSETGPAYSQENTGTPEQPAQPIVVPVPAAAPTGQIQSSLAKTGEQIQSSIDSGLNQVNSSLSAASEKTEAFLENAGQQISSSANQIGSSIQNGYNQTVENIKDAGTQIGSSLQSQTAAAGEQISSSIQGAAAATAAAGAALQGSLSQNDPRNQPLQISLGSSAQTDTSALSLAPADGRSGGSSLGDNAAAVYNPAPAQTAVQPAAPQTAAAAPAVSAADAEAVFNAEPDLSAMDGFDEIQMSSEPAFSSSLSPFGNSYALPQETVPTVTQNSAAQSPAAGTEQLSSLTYNPADNSASSGYNNMQNGAASGSQAVYGNMNQAAAGYREYTTKTGDNLITIAKNELGDGARWSEISKMNPGLNLRGNLQGGIVLRLPASTGSGN